MTTARESFEAFLSPPPPRGGTVQGPTRESTAHRQCHVEFNTAAAIPIL